LGELLVQTVHENRHFLNHAGNKAKLQKGEVVPEAIPTGPNSNKTETTAAPAIIASSGPVINVGVSSLIPWPTFSYSSGIPKDKKTNSGNVSQTKAPSVSKGYTSAINVGVSSLIPWPTFSYSSSIPKDKKTNSGNVSQTKAPSVSKGYTSASSISSLFANAGRAGIVNSLQQAATECSVDGAVRIGNFRPR